MDYNPHTQFGAPSYNQVPPNASKEEAARILYPGQTIDTALPQHWVDMVLTETGFDVRTHFVWGYPPHSCVGRPYPLTQAGHDWWQEYLQDGVQ